MAKYGIPYMGSKQAIANKILTILPKAENFYDLFGGGFSISHCALLSKKYNHVHFNEINPGITTLIKDAIAGKYSYKIFKPPFISKEEFDLNKDKNTYIKYVWSFGNSGKTYLFGKDIEPIKKSLHQAVIFGEFDETANKFFGFTKWKTDDLKHRRLISRRIAGIKLRSGELQQLQQLERLERLCFYSADYRSIDIKENSIIYLDPPYKGTTQYSKDAFNQDELYNWIRESKHPIYMSEYTAPKEFRCIASIGKTALLKHTNEQRDKKQEKIFTNKIGYDYYKTKG